MVLKRLSRLQINSLLRAVNPSVYNTLPASAVVWQSFSSSSSSPLPHSLPPCELSPPISVPTRCRYDWGSWDNRIDFNILLQESINYGKPIPKITTDMAGTASVIGRRTANEDRIRIKELRPDLLYYAIFDGHGGSLAADFCSQKMEQYITYWLQRGETDLEAILQNSFIEVNNALACHIALNVKERELMFTGTTATVCLLKNSVELTIANVGDSRALLCRNGDARKLTIDHSPSLKSEKERIMKSGGSIIANSHGTGLVNGRLAMTRSIGDLDLKSYGVIALPYTRSLEVKHGKDSFLVMATDGVSFVMNDQEIVDAASRCTSPSEAANLIVEQALHYACDDNASSIVIPFGAWGKTFHNRSTVSYGSFGRELCRSNRF